MFEGGLYSLYRGASNRVLLAFMPKDQQDRLIQTFDLPQEEEKQLRADLDLAVKRGYDLTIQTMTTGLYAIGFPIYNSRNILSAGLSFGGIVGDMGEDEMRHQIQEARFLAINANRKMGSTCCQF